MFPYIDDVFPHGKLSPTQKFSQMINMVRFLDLPITYDKLTFPTKIMSCQGITINITLQYYQEISHKALF